MNIVAHRRCFHADEVIRHAIEPAHGVIWHLIRVFLFVLYFCLCLSYLICAILFIIRFASTTALE